MLTPCCSICNNFDCPKSKQRIGTCLVSREKKHELQYCDNFIENEKRINAIYVNCERKGLFNE